MKKVIFLVSFLVYVYTYSQNIVITSEQRVMPSNWSAYLDLHDDHYGTVTFKEGSGVVVQRIRVSEGKYNMRRVDKKLNIIIFLRRNGTNIVETLKLEIDMCFEQCLFVIL